MTPYDHKTPQQGTPVHGSSTAEPAVPILAYHRIADDGPTDLAAYRVCPEVFAQQIVWFSQHDYQSVSLESLSHALHGEKTLPERAGMLTFDEGYADFAQTAWPILEDHGFSAVVFIVTGTVGGRADWDARYGDPVPLMPWHDIRALGKKNVEFGSHTHGHKRLRALTDVELDRELRDSRMILKHATGRSVHALS